MANNNSDKVHLLSTLEEPLVKCGICQESATWIINHVWDLDLDAFHLLQKLDSPDIRSPSEYLTFSTVVSIGDYVDDFIEMYQANQHWIVDQGLLFENIQVAAPNPKVDLEYMEELLNLMTMPYIKNVLSKRRDEYRVWPLKEWLQKLQDSKEEAAVTDVASVQDFLTEFSKREGEQSLNVVDIRETSAKIKSIISHIKCQPNSLQFAVA